ncbi:MAG: hypothetical protein ACYCX9_05745 [Candidatus Dormibacteria bacterium]|jgi:hypothetical protein
MKDRKHTPEQIVRKQLGYGIAGYGSVSSPTGWNRAIERARRRQGEPRGHAD